MTAEDYNNSIIEMNTQDYIDLANQQSMQAMALKLSLHKY
jgi:hypothetical protein